MSLSRRRLLGLAAAAGLLAEPSIGRAGGDEPPARLQLRLPAATSNGGRVPVSVEVTPAPEAMPDGVVLEVVNPRDPVPLKGVFHFTPANGRAAVAFQARFDEGPSTVAAAATWPRHGSLTTTAPLTVAAGAGGCAGGAPTALRPDSEEIRPPVIRIPRLVAGLDVRAGEVIDVQVKTRHPNRTGLAFRDGAWVRESEPFHLTALEVFYDGRAVSRFVLGAALSDNPLITFPLRARSEGPVRVTLTNTRGQRFEASHLIRPV